MATRGLGPETADTRVMMPRRVYDAAQRIAQKQLLSYSNWAARIIWRAVMQDVDEQLRLRKTDVPPKD